MKNDWRPAVVISVLIVCVFAFLAFATWVSRAHAAEPQKCYMIDPADNYCITGASPRMIILPAPDELKKDPPKDRHIDLQAELQKLTPTDPICRTPFPVPCP